jgi:hypothetical protein
MRRCAIIFELTEDRGTGPFLLHLAVVFHQLRINPLSLHLDDVAPGRPVRTSQVIVGDEQRLSEFVEALTETDGIRNVRLQYAENARVSAE